ncbi:MAG: GAF domain-containing protein [Candidatus Bathyarchaeota archaeon]
MQANVKKEWVWSVCENPIRVLLVDSDHQAARFTKVNLRILAPDIEVTLTGSPGQALEKLKQEEYHCVVSEYALPEMHFVQLCSRVKELTDLPFILYTGWRDEELAEQAYTSGVDTVIRKEESIGHFNILVKGIRDAVEAYWQRRLYRDIVEGSRDAIMITVESTIKYVNDAFLDMFRATHDKVVDSSIMDFMGPLERRLIEGVEAQTIVPRRPIIYEIAYSPVKGVEHRYEASASSMTYRGQTAKLFFIRDVTDRRERDHLLKALYNHLILLEETKEVSEVADITLDIMEQVLGFQFACFQLERGGVLHAIGTRGAPLISKGLPLTGNGVTVRAAVTGRTQYVPDIRVDPDFIKGSTDSLSELAVPVIIGDRAVAVLNVERLEADAFTAFDQQLLETLALQVASALKGGPQLTRMEHEKVAKSLNPH